MKKLLTKFNDFLCGFSFRIAHKSCTLDIKFHKELFYPLPSFGTLYFYEGANKGSFVGEFNFLNFGIAFQRLQFLSYNFHTILIFNGKEYILDTNKIVQIFKRKSKG